MSELADVTETWQPSPSAVHQGQRAFVHYLGGVLLLNSPNHAISAGIIGELGESQNADGVAESEAVITHAEDLMYNGLRQVIKSANPAVLTLAQCEARYVVARPHLERIVESSYERYGKTIDEMNPAFQALRPAPVYDETIYNFLCHSRRTKLHTVSLMDGVMVAPRFSPWVSKHRKLSDSLLAPAQAKSA